MDIRSKCFNKFFSISDEYSDDKRKLKTTIAQFVVLLQTALSRYLKLKNWIFFEKVGQILKNIVAANA